MGHGGSSYLASIGEWNKLELSCPTQTIALSIPSSTQQHCFCFRCWKSFLSGMAAKRLPLWLVLVIGSILGLIGYGLKYLAITFHISFLLSSSIFAPTFIAGNSICWRNTVCYVAIIDNFPSHRQVLVGMITSYQGLSAKMFTDIVHAVMPSATGKKLNTIFY